MRLVAWVPRSGAVLVVVAACGGSAFSTSGGDAGSGSSSGGGSGGSSSGGSSGGSGSGGSSGSSGGSGSSSGGASSSGGMADASSSDGMPGPGDGSATGDAVSCSSPPTQCGSMVCDGTGGQQGELCCVNPGGTPVFGCASCSCGCSTQLECPVPTGCGTGRVCCITQEACGGAGQHWVAQCKGLAQCMGKRICDPAGSVGADCTGAGTTCSPDTSGVGIPANTGYGVCM